MYATVLYLKNKMEIRGIQKYPLPKIAKLSQKIGFTSYILILLSLLKTESNSGIRITFEIRPLLKFRNLKILYDFAMFEIILLYRKTHRVAKFAKSI